MMSWDLSLIASGISDIEKRKIQNIRLSRHLTKDIWTWLPDKKGNFSVKSTYGLAVSKHGYDNNHYNQIIENGQWKCIWHLSNPPKIRHCLWRACSNALPTNSNLHRRIPKISPMCPVLQWKSKNY